MTTAGVSNGRLEGKKHYFMNDARFELMRYVTTNNVCITSIDGTEIWCTI